MEKRMFKISVTVLLSVSVLVVLSGCASHVALTKENKASLKTASVSQHVVKPDRIMVVNWMGIAQSELEAELKLAMEKWNLDPGKIFRYKFIDNLKGFKWPFAVVERGGDAEFKLEVLEARFSKTAKANFEDNLQLRLTMEASLVKQDGTILWKHRAVETVEMRGTSASKAFNISIRNPDYIHQAFSLCADFVCAYLVNDLWGK